MNIVLRNFFNILRSGAFNDEVEIEPMSAHKWRRLYQMVEAQHLKHIFAHGAHNHREDKCTNLPNDILENVNDIQKQEDIQEIAITEKEVRFSSRILNHRLKNVINKELHNIDTSIESIDLLEIIVFNITSMLNNGISLNGIIKLGKYLRTRGDKVDFLKIEDWIEQLHITKMAQLQGSILISMFGFDKEELPFIKNIDKNAYNLTVRSISYLAEDTAKDWESQHKENGFMRSNSYRLRKNLKRSIRYYNYAPMETTSTFFTNLGRSLSEIEE